jgi:DNA-directed RNA polymerase specialized sigma24 family protein
LVQPEFVQRSVEYGEAIEHGLACLNPAQRRIIEMMHFEGHTLREISQMKGKALTAIRNSYYRGLNSLKALVGEAAGLARARSTESAKKREEYEIKL